MLEDDLGKLKAKANQYKSTVAELEKAEKTLSQYLHDKEMAVAEADEAVINGNLDVFYCVRERISIVDMLIHVAQRSTDLFRITADKQILEIIEDIDRIE